MVETKITIRKETKVSFTAGDIEEIVKEYVKAQQGSTSRADVDFNWDKMYEGSNGSCTVIIKENSNG